METFSQIAWMDWLKQYLDIGVFSVLGLMSFLMVGFVIERLLFFARIDVTAFADRHQLSVALTKHLTSIASVASNAPYIGLLGTVLGILVTFHDLSLGEGLSANAVMLGLALALKATAAGLLVAIPATLAYNGLLRRVDVLTSEWASQRGAP